MGNFIIRSNLCVFKFYRWMNLDFFFVVNSLLFLEMCKKILRNYNKIMEYFNIRNK